MAARGDYQYVAALDFGTTYSGYAFSTRDKPDDIFVNKNWGTKHGYQSYKTPTSILTDAKGKFIAMGVDAETKYAESLAEESESGNKLQLYRHFKMILQNSKDVKINSVVVSIDGTMSPAVEVFGYAINFLREHLLEALAKISGKTPKASDIFWVLTVPAIWSEPSKKFMREAAKRGGCIKEVSGKNLLLALEPEAASLCCRRQKIAGYEQTIGGTVPTFPEGTRYIVLDCGGGTVDVTAHLVIKDEKIEEILPASGGPWGGTYVDKNFDNLLCEIFGADAINKFKANHPEAWLKLRASFETVKKGFQDNKESKLRVDLPYAFTTGDKTIDVESKIKNYDNTYVKFSNGALVLGNPVAKKLFDEVKTNIVRHVKSLLSKSKLKEAQFIFMVGGFSECSYLQDAIKKKFEKNGLKVLVPHDCQLAVLRGAVLFGHYPIEITSRISRITFGRDVSRVFDPNVHVLEKRYIGKDGDERCSDIFSPIVKIGDLIEVGQEIRMKTSPDSAASTVSKINFYSMTSEPKEPIQYIDGEGVEYLGNIKIEHSAGKDKRDNTNEHIYTFGGTEVHIRVIHEATGKEATTCLDFLSQAE